MMQTLQIETTTRCTLKCPACSRTIFTDKTHRAQPHYDIDADQLYRFLDCSQGKKIDTLSLCGDYGDSIYYPDLFYFLEKFKSDRNIHIVTNGSYRNKEFWRELVSRLDKNDRLIFSIDGLKDTNHLYRVNSDWDSIMLGLDTVVAAGIPVTWESNIFSFNYNQLDKIKQFAESRGAVFRAKKTARFGRDDLIPPDDFINQQEVYKAEYVSNTNHVDIVPDCKNNLRRNTVCAQNYFWPCGYIRSPLVFYKSKLWKNKEQWSTKDKTLDDLMSTVLADWVKNIEDNPVAADIVCKIKCKRNQPEIVEFYP